MKKRIDVPSGEVVAGQGDVILNSIADGPCIVIAAYDASRKVGCIAHASFQNGSSQKRFSLSFMRDPDSAIDEMIKDMELLGSDKDHIEVALVSGENLTPEEKNHGLGGQVNSMLGLLKQKNIHCRENKYFDAGSFHISLNVGSGEIFYHQ